MRAHSFTTATIARCALRSAAAAVLIAAAGFGVAHAGAGSSRVGWVLANKPSVSTYAPPAHFSYSSVGGAVTIDRSTEGAYIVVFTGMNSSLADDVQVTQFGGSGYCTSAGWTSTASEDVFVLCFDAHGAPQDNEFSLVYQAHSGMSGDDGKGTAFLWANQPTAASYTPATTYQYNSTGGTNTMIRHSTGSYTATIPGLTKLGGHVEVTAYGNSPARCKVTQWSQDATGTEVDVQCFGQSGAPQDEEFDLSYTKQEPVAFVSASQTGGFYAWAQKPKSSTYNTSGPYSYNSFGAGKVSSANVGKGAYDVQVPSVPDYASSNVLVTAVGPGSDYCNVDGWYPISVVCYAQGGKPQDSQFDVSFQTH